MSSLSPPSSPRHRGSRVKSPRSAPAAVGGYGGSAGSFRAGGRAEFKNAVERFGCFLISAMYRRRGVLMFAPLLYISGILMYMGTMGFNSSDKSSSAVADATGPGSVYRSPQVFEKLWPFMEAESNRSSNMVI